MRRLLRPLIALLLAAGALPARAAVTLTFWSHELGNSFPHAFITLRGVPDAGGAPVDGNYGFTARSVTPALLFGSVPGEVEPSMPGFVATSDAQFAVVLTDAQYAEVLALIAAWDEKTGDGRYNLNNRNCVHFVKAAARIVGLAGLDQPGLMKRPRSYLLAVEAANDGRVVKVNQHGRAYVAALPPLTAATVTDPASASTPGQAIGDRPAAAAPAY
ncbi:hypothetical protein [Sphingomonas bacterium]|uniref:hypothetical protein n=1 Tax=Sphingomonas bacterium TaxID=1895847 RepID=UPI0020C637BA|nr:hypothetical protein [Sphingomonas bacterium]